MIIVTIIKMTMKMMADIFYYSQDKNDKINPDISWYQQWLYIIKMKLFFLQL